MSRYIDADALYAAFRKDIMGGLNWERILDEAPTVDAVPVEQIESFIGWIERNGYTLLKKAIINALHDYRADGERRSDGE